MELLAVIVGLEKLKNKYKSTCCFWFKYVVDSILKNGFFGRKTILDEKMLIYGSAC
jgi:hypothetical protein